MISVIDGTGDLGSTSPLRRSRRIDAPHSLQSQRLRLARRLLRHHQLDAGGWSLLSSEGRYMGAASYGDCDRQTNAIYPELKNIFSLAPEGQVHLNRALANWQCDPFDHPYTPELTRILGAPIAAKDMWNPDAVLRVEDIHHKANTQERLDKAAATQMVFEDALIHIIDFFIRHSGSDRLIMTGGTALNAVANMRLLEHFDDAYFDRALGKRTRLHIWVPPVPNDAGVTMGAAYLFAHQAGAGTGPPLDHCLLLRPGPDRTRNPRGARQCT
mgnify:CR=1 FL=1